MIYIYVFQTMKLHLLLLILTLKLLNPLSAQEYPGMVYLNIQDNMLVHQGEKQINLIIVNASIYNSDSPIISDTVIFAFFQQPTSTEPCLLLQTYFESDTNYIFRHISMRIIDKRENQTPCLSILNDHFPPSLICKSIKGKWMEVAVSGVSQETMWIQKSDRVDFVSWKKLHRKETYVCIKPRGPLYEKPDAQSNINTIVDGVDIWYEITAIRGNWMRLQSGKSDYCYNEWMIEQKGWTPIVVDGKLMIDIRIN